MDEVDNFSKFLFIVVVILIIVLIIAEGKAHDCVPGKVCTHSVPPPLPTDDIQTYIDKLKNETKNLINFVCWRLAMISALIGTIIIVYLIRARIPKPYEYLLIGVIIFFLTYIILSFIQYHYHYPNGYVIEDHLTILRDRLRNEGIV